PLQLAQALFEVLALAPDSRSHVVHHAAVLPAQAAEFEQLFDRGAPTRAQRGAYLAVQLVEFAAHVLGSDLALLRNQLAAQRVLEVRHAAALEQQRVTIDPG